MSIKKKLLLSTLTIAVVAASFSIGAYAATTYDLIINGKKANTDIIVKNNTTYVPLRLVSESLGAKVGFDGKTITVDSPDQSTPTENKPSTPPSTTNSRSNPAAIGTTVPFKVKSVFEDYGGSVTLLEVVRGEQANKMVAEANKFNGQPTDGYEYLLAKVKFALTDNKNGAALSLSQVDYDLFSTKGVKYDLSMGVSPDPQYSTDLFPGAEHTGWLLFEVKKDDVSPLITHKINYDGTGGIWFKTK